MGGSLSFGIELFQSFLYEDRDDGMQKVCYRFVQRPVSIMMEFRCVCRSGNPDWVVVSQTVWSSKDCCVISRARNSSMLMMGGSPPGPPTLLGSVETQRWTCVLRRSDRRVPTISDAVVHVQYCSEFTTQLHVQCTCIFFKKNYYFFLLIFNRKSSC